MTNFDFRQVAISSLGALALSATCVLAAVGPARAAAPASAADWSAKVQRRIDGADIAALGVRAGRVAEAQIVARFAADGDFAGVTLARSSGNATVDAAALRIARNLHYPALPAGYRGRAQAVTLRLAFGDESEVAGHFARTASPRVDVAALPASFQVAAE